MISVLDITVAQKKFEIATEELISASSKYSGIWVIDGTHFPLIKLIIKNSSGKPSIGLLLNLRNYDFMPPSVRVMDTSFKRPLNLKEIPCNLDDAGQSHVVQDQYGRVWFCEVGTFEYHFLYKEDPWELVNTDNSKILSIVERILALIDRAKL